MLDLTQPEYYSQLRKDKKLPTSRPAAKLIQSLVILNLALLSLLLVTLLLKGTTT